MLDRSSPAGEVQGQPQLEFNSCVESMTGVKVGISVPNGELNRGSATRTVVVLLRSEGAYAVTGYSGVSSGS